jgi:serine protease inhibitor
LIGKVNMKHNNTDYKINLTMPKFKIESHWKEFDKTLNALGINKIMAEGDNMNRLAKNLYVSKICQDVAVDVNEDGTEAAAVSTGGMYATAISPNESLTITFNRPFLFYIVENDTGSVLFMGKIANL